MTGKSSAETISALQIKSVQDYFKSYQTELCDALAGFEESQNFIADDWKYESGAGGGRSCVLGAGDVIEQGGVNFSLIRRERLPAAATSRRPALADARFMATGVSAVMHPLNPFCPTSHANVRFFVAYPDSSAKKSAVKETSQWWFGGGFDLTPFYAFKEDVILWHQHARQACQDFGGDATYQRFKKQCDDYFYLPHRKEARGIGGLFFDDLFEAGFDACFDFIKKVGAHYLAAYVAILTKRHSHTYSDLHRHFQCYRRGRYVEFNLLNDRGTAFGLQSGGRTESILMSLPPEVRWRYDYRPEIGTQERELYDDFLPVKDWLRED